MGRIAPLAAALCIALAAGCDGQHAAAPAGQTSEPSARRQLPVADPPLDREALLLEVVRAASAAATATATRTLATRNELSIQPPPILECVGANCTRASSGIHKIRVKMACSLECGRP